MATTAQRIESKARAKNRRIRVLEVQAEFAEEAAKIVRLRDNFMLDFKGAMADWLERYEARDSGTTPL